MMETAFEKVLIEREYMDKLGYVVEVYKTDRDNPYISIKENHYSMVILRYRRRPDNRIDFAIDRILNIENIDYDTMINLWENIMKNEIPYELLENLLGHKERETTR